MLVIGLIRDDVTCSKFTTKPRLRYIFSNLLCLRVIFTWVFFSSLLLWEFKFMIKFKICILKARLGGDLAALMSSCTRAIPKLDFRMENEHSSCYFHERIWHEIVVRAKV